MKVFQIESGFVHWDATREFPTKESTVGYFHPDVLFVEAPDYVFEGWGYLDGEFIKPTPPEGWLYDDATGTFYQEGYEPPKPLTLESLKQENDLLRKQLQAQSDRNDFIEDCIAEMAMTVYSN